MKIKYLKIVSVLILVTTLSTSCKKYLDVNRNPNVAEVVDPKLLFSTTTIQYVNLRASGDLWVPMSLVSQAVASNGNTDGTVWGTPSEEQYDVNALSLGNTWRYLYASTSGGNLKEMIRLSESAPVKNNNAAAQAKVLLSFMIYDATVIYGDVPFTEAWRADVSYPKFDTQQSVFDNLIKLLDEAYTQFDEASPLKVSDYDLFYQGNIAKWKAVARSLKLRILMTMVDKDPSKAAAIGQALTAGGFISSPAGNFQVAYPGIAGRYNPKWGLYNLYNSGQSFFGASKWALNFMNPINDPRRAIYFEKPATAANYVAPEPAQDIDPAVHSRINRNFQHSGQPEVLFTYQEVLFYQAEAYARGLGVTTDLTMATTLYKKAVEESVKHIASQSKDVAAAATATAAAASFAASLPALSTFATNREAVKYIHYHHWIDKMDRGIDVFTQWRRSGPEGDEVPAITLPPGAPAGGLFRRYEYPITNEISANPNAPKDKILYNVKMWFDL
ncbi:MAG: SusD/RagB family nutrient-binding outer membrane lipoprotein [Chitinophagaceae bacterium]